MKHCQWLDCFECNPKESRIMSLTRKEVIDLLHVMSVWEVAPSNFPQYAIILDLEKLRKIAPEVKNSKDLNLKSLNLLVPLVENLGNLFWYRLFWLCRVDDTTPNGAIYSEELADDDKTIVDFDRRRAGWYREYILAAPEPEDERFKQMAIAIHHALEAA